MKYIIALFIIPIIGGCTTLNNGEQKNKSSSSNDLVFSQYSNKQVTQEQADKEFEDFIKKSQALGEKSYDIQIKSEESIVAATNINTFKSRENLLKEIDNLKNLKQEIEDYNIVYLESLNKASGGVEGIVSQSAKEKEYLRIDYTNQMIQTLQYAYDNFEYFDTSLGELTINEDSILKKYNIMYSAFETKLNTFIANHYKIQAEALDGLRNP